MSQSSLNSVSNIDILSAAQVYNSFLDDFIKQACVFGLYGNGWALSVTEQGQHAIAIWQHPTLASAMSKDSWSQYLAQRLPIDIFVNEIIPYLSASNLLISINLNDQGQHIQIAPDRFLLDLKKKLYPIYLDHPEKYKTLNLPEPRKIRLHDGSV